MSAVPEGREKGRLQQFSLAGGKKHEYNTTYYSWAFGDCNSRRLMYIRALQYWRRPLPLLTLGERGLQHRGEHRDSNKKVIIFIHA